MPPRCAIAAVLLLSVGSLSCTARAGLVFGFDAAGPDVPIDDFVPAPSRWVMCADGRFDIANDNLRCGSCNHACNAALHCVDGACAPRPPCGALFARCGATCVDLRSNRQHCGACDRLCPSDATCQAGVCRCQSSPLAACGPACVDTRTNTAHCGGCGRVCNGPCDGGVCTCVGGLTLCAGTCVDVRASASHCGRCGQVCTSGACRNGVCDCPGVAMAFCAGACVDVRTNLLHCGACGRACTTIADCIDGVCVPRPSWPVYGARVGTRTPTLRWNGDVTSVELCADPTCERVLQRMDASPTRRVTAQPLSPGVYYWRVVVRTPASASATSMFRIDARDTPRMGVLPPFLDMNGDTLADLAVVSGRPGMLSVYTGARGGLSTVAVSSLSLGEFVDSALLRAAGDINGDGVGDLGVSRGTAQAVWGARLLPSALVLRGGSPPGISQPTHDLNGDGLADSLVLNTSATSLCLFGRDGVSVTGLRVLAHPTGVVPWTGGAAVGDLNGDDYPDVAIGAPAVRPRRVYVYFGSSVGPDRASPLVSPPLTEGYGDEVRTAGDLNGDGYADLLVGLGTQGAAVYLGDADVPTLAQILRAPADSELAVYAAGDVDADGFYDLLGIVRGRGDLLLYHGERTGVREAPTRLRDARFDAIEVVSAAGDLNGDGYDDVALGAPARDVVYVLYGSATPFARIEIVTGRARTEFGRALQ